MNLFVTSPDPKYCAKYLDTKRLGWGAVKESAQLIATALNITYRMWMYLMRGERELSPRIRLIIKYRLSDK